MANELKKRLEELARLEEITKRADDELMANPQSTQKEEAFDVAYWKEYNAFMAVAELIVEMAGGKINIKTAKAMVRTKRNEILNLVA